MPKIFLFLFIFQFSHTFLFAQKTKKEILEDAYFLMDSYKLDEAEKLILDYAEKGDIEAQYLISNINFNKNMRDEGWKWLLKANSNKWIPNISTKNEDTLRLQYLSQVANPWGVKNTDGSPTGFLEFRESKRDSIIKVAAIKNIYSAQVYYYKNFFFSKDSSEAIKWVKIAANNKHTEAFEDLAQFYRYGLYVKKDIDSSIYWYSKAMEAEYDEAFFDFGKMYEEGKDVVKDLDKALLTYQKLLDIYSQRKWHNSEDVSMLIGDVYFQKKDYQSAIRYYLDISKKISSVKSVNYTNYKLGEIYAILQKYNKAFYYLKKSNLPEARMKLKELINR